MEIQGPKLGVAFLQKVLTFDSEEWSGIQLIRDL